MAERRMFAKTIVLSDMFLDMPLTARCLYFTLGMFADDDGFINSPKGIIRQCGASEDDMKILIAKKFILPFDSGIIVIKHWRINNYLRADRHKNTIYKEELSELTVSENGGYTKSGIPNVGIPSMGTPSIGKVRLGKDSIGKDIEEKKKSTPKPPKNTIPPTLEMVTDYISEKKLNIDAERFYDYYEGNGWKVGRNKMKDWQATIRGWNARNKQEAKADSNKDWDFMDL